MLLALALASSLWASAQEAGARAPSSAVSVTPVEAIADDFGRDLAWLVASNAADLYSTAWAIHRCNGACGESNPFGPTVEARVALKMAMTASSALTIWKLRRDGHGKTATVMRWATVISNGAFVLNNSIHAIRKR